MTEREGKRFDADRFLSDDPEYQRQVIDRHSEMVMLVCRSHSADYDHAADLYQRVWLRVFEKLHAYEEGGGFAAWLHRVATNICLDDVRQRSARARLARGVERAGYEGGHKTIDPLEFTARREFQLALHRAIPQLSDRERTTLILRVIDGRSTQEVADQLSVTPATVRSHLRHALNRLRRIIDDPNSDLYGYRSSG